MHEFAALAAASGPSGGPSGGAAMDDDATPACALCDLPDDVLERVACAIANDLCAGVTSLVMLSRCDQRLHSLALSAETLGRCAA